MSQQQGRDVKTDPSRITSTSRGPVEIGWRGEGYPIVVLHGCPGGYMQGLSVGRGLSEAGFRVIALSRPGYLRTPIESGQTPGEQADLVASLLNELGIDEAIVLGISAGGPAALQVALRHGDRVSGLIMVSTITQSFDKPFIDTGNSILNRLVFTAPVLALRNIGIQLALRYRPEKVLEELLSDESTMTPAQRDEHIEYILDRPAQRTLLNEAVRSVSALRPRRAGLVNDERTQSELPDYSFDKIECPVLAVHGEHDREVPLVHAETLVSNAPRAELVTLDASHVVWLGPDSSRFQAAVETFANGVVSE